LDARAAGSGPAGRAKQKPVPPSGDARTDSHPPPWLGMRLGVERLPATGEASAHTHGCLSFR
jgi:hypothetical protein